MNPLQRCWELISTYEASRHRLRVPVGLFQELCSPAIWWQIGERPDVPRSVLQYPEAEWPKRHRLESQDRRLCHLRYWPMTFLEQEWNSQWWPRWGNLAPSKMSHRHERLGIWLRVRLFSDISTWLLFRQLSENLTISEHPFPSFETSWPRLRLARILFVEHNPRKVFLSTGTENMRAIFDHTWPIIIIVLSMRISGCGHDLRQFSGQRKCCIFLLSYTRSCCKQDPSSEQWESWRTLHLVLYWLMEEKWFQTCERQVDILPSDKSRAGGVCPKLAIRRAKTCRVPTKRWQPVKPPRGRWRMFAIGIEWAYFERWES